MEGGEREGERKRGTKQEGVGYRRECGANGQGLDKEQETTGQTGSKLFPSERNVFLNNSINFPENVNATLHEFVSRVLGVDASI